MTDPRTVSFWMDSLPDDQLNARERLSGDANADVVIIGAGYTGLWTAYYLHRLDPSLRIVIVEAEFAGFGASGRNGGWLSALLPMTFEKMAAGHGRAQAIAMQNTMHDAVDEVARVTAAEGIDCHLAKGGYLNLARNEPQVRRVHELLAYYRSWGFGEDDYRWLDADEAAGMLNASNVLGAGYTPHCGVVHPARLVRGLADVVERAGTTIYEQTRVIEIGTRKVRCETGTVSADVIVRATEGFTARLPGLRRAVAPIYSLMIATEPLPASFFDEVGWARRETFNDDRRLIIYGQRTADDRIAFGGRGAPYHFASAIRPEFDRHAGVQDSLRTLLGEMFPALGDASVTHRWGGPIGAPRDWFCSVGFDQATGHAWAGGYVGDGVTTTNLAGRTLADLILHRDTDLVALPWVNHRSRKWEPEPLRWLGINAMLRLPIGADHYEERTGKTEKWRSTILEKFIGH
ncbi:MAG TPA: FAD-dependent oxidoreductase [Ilumatobacteraceae bacterium]|nr:FAD-dependent oxidoreductase [Ilumatobacteraceae bacterium]